jgi:ADP-ribose pyrophosphatase YjhB (NUDIX family)
MKPAQQIALWADKLRHLSAMGLRFSQNSNDRENYRQIQEIAMAMLALATGETFAQMELLRAPVFSRPTPVVTGDAAVIDGAGRILLIRRGDNGLWAMPGGALEVGETPAEGVAREAFEETGLRCEAVAFVGVHDSRLSGSQSRHHLYHFLFLCQLEGEDAGPQPAIHPGEVLDTRWFPEQALPADLSPGHATRIREAYRVWHGDSRAYFDR